MKKLVAEKWVAAIRSGDYPQKPPEKSKLKHENTWGILGILCELYRQEMGGEWIASYYVLPGHTRGTKSKLPDEVVKWAGLAGPWIGCPGVGAIGIMDDRPGCTHAEIADLITTYWEQL